jgi:hypothetical protein
MLNIKFFGKTIAKCKKTDLEKHPFVYELKIKR